MSSHKRRSFDDDEIMPPVEIACDWRLVWRAPHLKAGEPAEHIAHNGYYMVSYKNRRFLAHRLIWRLHYGYWPSGAIDHADCNRQNNSITNLRIATISENRHNTTKVRSSSGFKGVCWNKKAGKWQAAIGVRGRKLYLGVFTDPCEASEAYVAAAKVHFGEFAKG